MSGALDSLQYELGEVLGPLDAKAMQFHPTSREGAWSIQQIAEHLIRTYEMTVHDFEKQLTKGRRTRAKLKWQYRLAQTMVIKMGRFPQGRKASDKAQPPEILPPESGQEVMARIVERIQAMQDIFMDARRTFGLKRSVRHTVMGPMTVQQWRRYHYIHGRHHIKQMMAIRQELGL